MRLYSRLSVASFAAFSTNPAGTSAASSAAPVLFPWKRRTRARPTYPAFTMSGWFVAWPVVMAVVGPCRRAQLSVRELVADDPLHGDHGAERALEVRDGAVDRKVCVLGIVDHAHRHAARRIDGEEVVRVACHDGAQHRDDRRE